MDQNFVHRMEGHTARGEVTLPSMRTLLVVDTEGFTRNRDVDLPGMHTEIRHAVEMACERSGLAETWKAVRFLQGTGDGILAALPHDAMIPLIYPFIDHLQTVLAESAPRLRARGLRLRLRVALHAGLVDDEDPVTAGISTATNDVNRMLDCEPLRAALRDSHPDVTFVAVITSEEAFERFVRGGHTKIQPSQFTKVRATVKQFDQPAFVYIPTPSQRTHTDVRAPQDEGDSVPPPTPTGGMSFGNISVTGAHTQSVIGNQGADIRQERS
jgi:hypothetical protein